MPDQDPSDFRLLPEMARLARPEAEAFLAFNKAAGRGDGAVQWLSVAVDRDNRSSAISATVFLLDADSFPTKRQLRSWAVKTITLVPAAA